MQQEYAAVTLPELRYGYNALEPILTGEILEVHHKKHHQKYVNEYNAKSQELIKKIYAHDVADVQKLCEDVAFNSGGHVSHAWYWENLAPMDNGGGQIPDSKSPLSQKIVETFGSYENMIKVFNDKTAKIKGSGWGWLGYCPITGGISYCETKDQDHIVTCGKVPLLTIDVWEHAYYLQYKNLRPDYLENIWKVVNWRVVEDRFNKANNHQKL